MAHSLLSVPLNLGVLHPLDAIEAAEQCGILRVPEVEPPVPLETALAAWDPARTLIEQSIGRGLRLPYGKRTGVTASVAEAEEIVDVLDPDDILTPGIYVQRLVQSEDLTKEIEQRTTRTKEGA